MIAVQFDRSVSWISKRFSMFRGLLHIWALTALFPAFSSIEAVIHIQSLLIFCLFNEMSQLRSSQRFEWASASVIPF